MEESRSAEELNMACFELSREIDGLDFSVPEARPLARTLLRVVGRIVIDCGGPGADPETWPNTREMAIEWINEAVRPLGLQLTDRGNPGS